MSGILVVDASALVDALLPTVRRDAVLNAVQDDDSFYVACAGALGAPLLTSDARLGRAPISGVTITLVT